MVSLIKHKKESIADPPEIERNRPGSPYAEFDLTSDSAAQKIGTYYIELQRRHAHWVEEKKQWQPPEALPGQTEVELHLLEGLVRHSKVNFWDASLELAGEDGHVTTWFGEGCEFFVEGLGLEVKTVGE